METLLDLVRILKSAMHTLCLLGESTDVHSMQRFHWQQFVIQQQHLLIHWLVPTAGASSTRYLD
jgi:hypothetical protein